MIQTSQQWFSVKRYQPEMNLEHSLVAPSGKNLVCGCGCVLKGLICDKCGHPRTWTCLNKRSVKTDTPHTQGITSCLFDQHDQFVSFSLRRQMGLSRARSFFRAASATPGNSVTQCQCGCTVGIFLPVQIWLRAAFSEQQHKGAIRLYFHEDPEEGRPQNPPLMRTSSSPCR